MNSTTKHLGKMATKKAQPKKAKRERVTLASLDRKIGLIESRLATLNAYEKMMEEMADARTATAEPKEEPLKVGDYIYITEEHSAREFWNTVVQVKRVLGNGCPEFDHPASRTGQGDAVPGMWRRATPAEIADHKRKMQEAEKKAAEEAEAAKPIAFGTRVEYQHDKGWMIAIDQPCGSAGWLANKSGTNKLQWMKRHEFTVLTEQP
jgi:surface antigen